MPRLNISHVLSTHVKLLVKILVWFAQLVTKNLGVSSIKLCIHALLVTREFFFKTKWLQLRKMPSMSSWKIGSRPMDTCVCACSCAACYLVKNCVKRCLSMHGSKRLNLFFRKRYGVMRSSVSWHWQLFRHV